MLNTKTLAAAALLATAGIAQAGIPANLTFSGFCDGMTNLVNTSGVVTGTHSFAACGLTDEATLGPAGKALAGAMGKGYALTEDGVAQFGYVLTYVINADGTWVGMSPDLGGVFNSGTWVKGAPAAAMGLKSTLGK